MPADCFAGLDLDDDTAAGPVPSGVPALPVPSPAVSVPRGARFGGATAGDGGHRTAPRAAEPDPAARRAAEDAVALLVRLRAEGRSGEAHVVLCEAASAPTEPCGDWTPPPPGRCGPLGYET